MQPQNSIVLVIDDDSRNILALTALLKTRGFTCISCTSAAEGISVMKNTEGIGVVLLDMMMPDMDGYEALKEIRNDVQIASVPVVAVTAQAMVGDREKCLEAGADFYVSKPVDFDLLHNIILKI